MLVVENVSFRYAGYHEYALRNASVACDCDGISVIVGRSGVGKSTLMSLLAGIYMVGDPVVGEYVGGIDVDGRAPCQIRGAEVVSWVPQAPVLLDHLTVLENVLLPTTIASTGASSGEKDAARSVLRKMELEGCCDWRPRELSGGMRTRVSLIRALISRPKYLFLDEPFGGLDLLNRWRIYRFLREVRSAANTATILTTHNIPEATALGDRIIVMSSDRGSTAFRVMRNEAKVVIYEDSDACLRRAREVAAPIEKELFLGGEEVAGSS